MNDAVGIPSGFWKRKPRLSPGLFHGGVKALAQGLDGRVEEKIVPVDDFGVMGVAEYCGDLYAL